MDMTLETERLGTRDEVGELAAVEWKRQWKLSAWGVETRMVS